jgi:hypothetical protein
MFKNPVANMIVRFNVKSNDGESLKNLADLVTMGQQSSMVTIFRILRNTGLLKSGQSAHTNFNPHWACFSNT